MGIIYKETSGEFHLFNHQISYIMKVMENGQMGQLYFGSAIRDREDFGYLAETAARSMSACVFAGNSTFSLEHLRQEFPSFGTTDYRYPAVDIRQKNGSRITDFVYKSHEIFRGKPALSGLPATYTESDEEAETLKIVLEDSLTGIRAELLYTLFAEEAAIARSVKFINCGQEAADIEQAMSMCLDLPDSGYEMLQLSGAWARERYIKFRRLEQGVQSVGSMRGHSSPHHNPFLALKRPSADEFQGEVIGCSLVYSGNFLAQVEVDTYDNSRILLGINPYQFCWHLKPGDSFQTPEAVIVYSGQGLNGMSQTYHRLYGRRLARGRWRDRERPILINNWEATTFHFDEDAIVEIARAAKEDGFELFVLDDGWFGKRDDDFAGLGDWIPNLCKLPGGITGLADQVEAMGMKFGLWFEPEMVNKDSDLYRAHPDWILETPGRRASHGRNQYVLDFSRPVVVDAIHRSMSKVLREAKISYVKWDMNRSITECFSRGCPAEQQGEIYHRYILGVYDLYERLIQEFPHILFESCASGGGRFDPGMLYYAPQCWASDDTDAVERLKIQYGTSMCYPISSIGAHVSAVPNCQVNRITPIDTRANVAYFGTFGYELDLNRLTGEEREKVREQVAFMKEHRRLLQFGTFYRLSSPFESNITAWMVVSEDQREAVVGWFRVLSGVNGPFARTRLMGLAEDLLYRIEGTEEAHHGDELMKAGLITTDGSAGNGEDRIEMCVDFMSRIYVLKAEQPL